MKLRYYFGLLIFGAIIMPFIIWICEIQADGSGYWSSHPLLLEYLPAFTATFLGVLIGISVESWLTEIEHGEREDDIKLMLDDEVKRMVKYLESAKGNNLQTQAWDSLISSGEISLIDINLQRRLFEIYDMVKNLNIDLRREELAEQSFLSDQGNLEKKNLHEEMHEKNRVKESALKTDLQKLIQDGVLKSN